MTFSSRLAYHLSDTSAIKQHLMKYSKDTENLTSSRIRKILNDNTRTVNKYDKSRPKILEAICIKKNYYYKKIAFTLETIY